MDNALTIAIPSSLVSSVPNGEAEGGPQSCGSTILIDGFTKTDHVSHGICVR